MFGKKPKPELKGFTLTEIAIVLGIIGLILGAVWQAASSVWQSQQINQATQEILAISQGTQALFASVPNTQSADGTKLTSALSSAGVIPSNMPMNGANTAATPWGQSSTFAVYAVSISAAGAEDGFLLELANLPASKALGACGALLLTISNNAQNASLYYATSNATSQAATNFSGIATNLPLSNATINASCNASTAYIDFVFKLRS